MVDKILKKYMEAMCKVVGVLAGIGALFVFCIAVIAAISKLLVL